MLKKGNSLYVVGRATRALFNRWSNKWVGERTLVSDCQGNSTSLKSLRTSVFLLETGNDGTNPPSEGYCED